MLLLCTITQTSNLDLQLPSTQSCQKPKSLFMHGRQVHVPKLGGALAPRMSLRLEVALLAACLRGQRPESESLSQLCLWSIWTNSQVGNPRIWSDWKGNGLLPLVTLDLSRPEEALQWILSLLLRYSFCGICGNELEGLALIARGQKSLFPQCPALHHLFCCHISPQVAPEKEQKSGKGFNGEDAIFHTLLLGFFCLCYIF